MQLARTFPPALAQRVSVLNAAYTVALLLMDLVMIRLALVLAYAIRQVGEPRALQLLGPMDRYDTLTALLSVATVVVLAVRQMYIPRRGVSRIDLLYQVAGLVALGWVFGLAAAFVVGEVLNQRLLTAYWLGAAILLVWLGRLLLDGVLREARARGFDVQRVLIVGDGEQAQLVEAKIGAAPELGYRVVGFVGGYAPQPVVEPVLGDLAGVARVVREQQIGEVFIAWPGLSHPDMVELVTSCTRESVNIKIYPDIFELMAREAETSELTGLPLMRVRDVALRGWSRTLKRGLDLAVSWAALVLLSPFLLLMALLVKLTSPGGPVLFVQQRVGLDGKPFEMIKFRSMRPDAEAETGPVFASPEDPRRTRLGTWLRRLSVDELPQLVNVLLGEMSLVGPRPERPEFVAKFSEIVPRYQERHNEKAGLTGWAQINGLRGQTSIEERTKYDLFYVENWSLAFDLKILLKTAAAVLRDRNAY